MIENGNGLDHEAEGDAPAPTKASKPKKAKAKAAAKGKAKADKPAKAAKAPKAKKAAKAAKPRKANPDSVDVFGLRKGSIKSKAAAMYARKTGATLAEVKEAVGSVQFNVIGQLEKRGHTVKRKDETNKATGRDATRFYLTAK